MIEGRKKAEITTSNHEGEEGREDEKREKREEDNEMKRVDWPKEKSQEKKSTYNQ